MLLQSSRYHLSSPLFCNVGISRLWLCNVAVFYEFLAHMTKTFPKPTHYHILSLSNCYVFIDVQPLKDILIFYETKPKQFHEATMAEKKVLS